MAVCLRERERERERERVRERERERWMLEGAMRREGGGTTPWERRTEGYDLKDLKQLDDDDADDDESGRESQSWEKLAREIWLRIQRESRKDTQERKPEQLERLTVETIKSLNFLTSISHRIDAERNVRNATSWKHCARYTVQASVWIQCELHRSGFGKKSESFAAIFAKFLTKNSGTLQKGVFDSTNLEIILSYLRNCKLPQDLFVPLVEEPEQYLDRESQDQLQSGQKSNLELVASLLPLLQLKCEAELVEPPPRVSRPSVDSENDIRNLILYALQFCINEDWNWKPSWTNADMSNLGSSILQHLLYDKISTPGSPSQVNLDVLSAALVRTHPTLHGLVVERYTKIMLKVESETTLYAVEDNESAFELTILLHTLNWLMLGMNFRSFVDEEYKLTETLFPIILHACNSSTQSMQYCGLQCLSLLIRSAPPTVIKWHKHELYDSLKKFIQHSETTIWSISMPLVVEAFIIIEGGNTDSDRLLELMENLVEQGEIMIHPKRYSLWFKAMTRLVPSLGVLSCCFLKRIIAIFDLWLTSLSAGADCHGALKLMITVIEYCWPGMQMYEQSMRAVTHRISERVSEEDALIVKTRKALKDGIFASKSVPPAISKFLNSKLGKHP